MQANLCIFLTFNSQTPETFAHTAHIGSDDEMCIDFVGYWPRDALQGYNQYCGVDTDKGEMLRNDSGTVASFARRFGTAGRARAGTATVEDLPAVVVAIKEGSQVPWWCQNGCNQAAMCYVEQPSGACNGETGKLELTGIGRLCKGGGESCAPCFPESPCYINEADAAAAAVDAFLTSHCATELEACTGSEQCQPWLAELKETAVAAAMDFYSSYYGGGDDGNGDYYETHIYGKPAVKDLVDCYHDAVGDYYSYDYDNDEAGLGEKVEPFEMSDEQRANLLCNIDPDCTVMSSVANSNVAVVDISGAAPTATTIAAMVAMLATAAILF